MALTKIRDEGWDFRSANTRLHVHVLHAYPAMMIPQVAGRILDEFGAGARLLFDPYCGTGTSLVEANLRGINAVGTDINPLARLIAKVKTTYIPPEELTVQVRRFILAVPALKAERAKVEPPAFPNIDYWFKKETQRDLAVIKNYIENLADEDVRDFFRVAFSETVRASSLTRKGEFKLYRMPKRQIAKFFPNVFTIMQEKLLRNASALKQYFRLYTGASTRIYDFNTVHEIPKGVLPPESVDIVVTSPPYGDSRTTVAYGQFSRLSNQWLGYEGANQVDKRSMGGKVPRALRKFGLEVLDDTIAQIAEIDERRAREVASFYTDYRASIRNVAKVVRKGGVVAYVVGNRRVKGVQIPTDAITAEFFREHGFEHVKTFIRAIPNKRMPLRNSPTNVSGITAPTMNYEYVVVLKKQI